MEMDLSMNKMRNQVLILTNVIQIVIQMLQILSRLMILAAFGSIEIRMTTFAIRIQMELMMGFAILIV
jgi:hypothetical protein